MLALKEYHIRFNNDPPMKWLSVQQCPECQALVVEDFMHDHLVWHAEQKGSDE